MKHGPRERWSATRVLHVGHHRELGGTCNVMSNTMEPDQDVWVLRPDFDRLCWTTTGPHRYVGPGALLLDGHESVAYRDRDLEDTRLCRNDRAFARQEDATIELIQRLSIQGEEIKRQLNLLLR